MKLWPNPFRKIKEGIKTIELRLNDEKRQLIKINDKDYDLAIAIGGEAVPSSTMIVTPAAVEQFFNVGADTFIDVPRGCCSTISIQNISTIPIEVQNANLIITREA